jgi:hypothetical protein
VAAEELSVVVATFALVVALGGLVVQARIHQANRAVPTVLQVILEYRRMATELELVASRRDAFPLTADNPGWDGIDDELRGAAWKVSSYFDHLGVLVAHRLVPTRPLLGYFSHPIVEHWNLLAPVIEAERVKRGGGHQEYFEMLVDLTAKHPADRIWRSRRRWLGLPRRTAAAPWKRAPAAKASR